MSIELLERGAAALGPLLDQVAFVGDATVALWITDPGAPAARPTKDVDVVIEVTTRSALHAFETALRQRGFSNDAESSVICRWRHDAYDLTLDAMPAAGGLLGFENPWQSAALPYAEWSALPSGARIRAATPPYLIATKLYAFSGRGGGDHLGSRDLEDIILLIDGREELVDELADADADVRAFIAAEIGALLDERRFTDAVFGFLRTDAASQERADSIILPALRALAGR